MKKELKYAEAGAAPEWSEPALLDAFVLQPGKRSRQIAQPIEILKPMSTSNEPRKWRSNANDNLERARDQTAAQPGMGTRFPGDRPIHYR
jgi:hypothetical protein